MDLKKFDAQKFAQNYNRVIDLIKNQCIKSNRNFDELTVIVVTKYIDTLSLAKIIKTGLVKNIGENRVQLLKERRENINTEIDWHMIGTLQSNKIKYIADYIKLIHSVNSENLINEINKHGMKKNRVIDALVEINTSMETNKTGAGMDEIFRLFEYCMNNKEINKLNNINICGLMTMAALDADEKECRRSFAFLKNAREKLNQTFGLNLKILSMGMSSDYLYAIDEGATHLRIGSVFFE